ncbi:MAG: 50S ribosomal protein L32 [Candidatus Levybacteria bacterium]|nr:50S ribosomal protein L32 [Candidatus Levybacteria bacterium]
MSHEPKKKHSTQRKGKRRAHIKLSVAMAAKCKNCGALGLSHQVCRSCGFYSEKQIIKVATPTVVRRRTVTNEG